MGYVAHDTVLIETVGEEREARIVAFRESLPERWRTLLIGPIPGLVNSTSFWAFMPDGSKEYWDTSDEGDVHREAFLSLLDEMRVDYVHVRWGGDYGIEVGPTIAARS